MQLARCPLRVALGGGTDLPPFADGYTVSVAVQLYVYAAVYKPMEASLVPSMLLLERRLLPASHRAVTWSDVPCGSGLGGSAATILAVAAAHGTHKSHLAELAYSIESEGSGGTTGRHDPYICALGSVRAMDFAAQKFTAIAVEPAWLRAHFALLYTGVTRSAEAVLRTFSVSRADAHRMRKLGVETEKLLLAKDLDGYAELMRCQWTLKQSLSPAVCTPTIAAACDRATKAGALAMRLAGAGGGGFLLLCVKDMAQLLASEPSAIPLEVSADGVHRCKLSL